VVGAADEELLKSHNRLYSKIRVRCYVIVYVQDFEWQERDLRNVLPFLLIFCNLISIYLTESL
jgi:hypothetical protein